MERTAEELFSLLPEDARNSILKGAKQAKDNPEINKDTTRTDRHGRTVNERVITWHNIEIKLSLTLNEIKPCPKLDSGGVHHIDIETKNQAPIPLTKTGYRSHWLFADAFDEPPTMDDIEMFFYDLNNPKKYDPKAGKFIDDRDNLDYKQPKKPDTPLPRMSIIKQQTKTTRHKSNPAVAKQQSLF